MRGEALNVRFTTSSRPDVRTTLVLSPAAVQVSLFASIALFLLFEFFDNLVQFVEARVPELAVSLDPSHLFLQSAHAESAGAHAPDFLRRDEPGLFQHA